MRVRYPSVAKIFFRLWANTGLSSIQAIKVCLLSLSGAVLLDVVPVTRDDVGLAGLAEITVDGANRELGGVATIFKVSGATAGECCDAS